MRHDARLTLWAPVDGITSREMASDLALSMTCSSSKIFSMTHHVKNVVHVVAPGPKSQKSPRDSATPRLNLHLCRSEGVRRGHFCGLSDVPEETRGHGDLLR